MKKKISNYTFNPMTKSIILSDYESLTIDAILIITNLATNTIIYNFAQASLGGSLTGNILTLNYNTTAMHSTDVLQIWIDDGIYNNYDANGNLYAVDQNLLSYLTGTVNTTLLNMEESLQNIAGSNGEALSESDIEIAINNTVTTGLSTIAGAVSGGKLQTDIWTLLNGIISSSKMAVSTTFDSTISTISSILSAISANISTLAGIVSGGKGLVTETNSSTISTNTANTATNVNTVNTTLGTTNSNLSTINTSIGSSNTNLSAISTNTANINQQYTTMIDQTSTSGYIYVGQALPSTALSASTWRIQIINLTTGSTQWAGGVSTFVNIWNNRTGYTYS